MFSRIIGQIMHVIYPVLVLGIALTAWSSSSLSDVRSTPPPIGDGFSFYWNPELPTPNSCIENKTHQLNQNCSNLGGSVYFAQPTNYQTKTN